MPYISCASIKDFCAGTHFKKWNLRLKLLSVNEIRVAIIMKLSLPVNTLKMGSFGNTENIQRWEIADTF